MREREKRAREDGEKGVGEGKGETRMKEGEWEGEMGRERRNREVEKRGRKEGEEEWKRRERGTREERRKTGRERDWRKGKMGEEGKEGIETTICSITIFNSIKLMLFQFVTPFPRCYRPEEHKIGTLCGLLGSILTITPGCEAV